MSQTLNPREQLEEARGHVAAAVHILSRAALNLESPDLRAAADHQAAGLDFSRRRIDALVHLVRPSAGPDPRPAA